MLFQTCMAFFFASKNAEKAAELSLSRQDFKDS